MSRICDLSGKKPVTGHKVSHSNRKTNRWFIPNLHTKRFFIPECDEWITLKVTAKEMRTIDKLGLFSYLKKLQDKGVKTGYKIV
ncbi:MAG: 50S ribosomal protein L28 [Saprospiraceae bacterium]|jgi:large subunit ribosomal protein L28|nr:50S ribosomal protein L28 [Saprospiraceae bacterium]MBL0191740.1 50S ribosomal protein L28 [Saprospiraceae bacterium]MBL0293902.1 50S ribosomal protein L28 [Saprospiraceae bacterium]